MQFISKDILQLIAERISDVKTFFSFSLVCHKTCEITRLLKDKKMIEFMRLKFWFCHSKELSLPVISIPYHTITINNININ